MYLGNENLRGETDQIDYTDEQIEEYLKCSNDMFYFIETYCKIDKNEGEIEVVELYPYQKKLLQIVYDNKFTICKFPRQCGKTTALAVYIIWCILFNKRFKVGVAADKDETALEIMDRIKTAYEYLPLWMQQGVKKWDEHKIRLSNGSRVEAAATTKKTFRGRSYNLVLLDEFAFVDQNIADPFWTSIYPVVSKGETNKMVIVSTPNGMNHYYKLYTEADRNDNEFKSIEIRWDEVPGRDEEFKIKTIKNIGIDRWEQEYDGSFLGSSSTLIPPAKLKTMTWNTPVDQIDGVKFFEVPQKGHVYFIGVDTGRGKGLDYSAFTVVDITQMPYKIVASFKDNEVSTMFYPSIIKKIGHMYNDAYVLVELNDAGVETSRILYNDLEYENCLSTMTKGRSGQVLTIESGTHMGVTTSKSVKAAGCSNLKSLVMNDQLFINDFGIQEELTTFEITGTSYAAKKGSHDDLVMSLVIFAWAAAQPYFIELTDTDIRTQMYAKRIEAMEEELVPAGFFPYDDEDIPTGWYS